MNVLQQNLAIRLTVVLVLTSALSLAFYLLENTGWAETIRSDVVADALDEPESSPGYLGIIVGSLVKPLLLMGIPLGLTLLIHRLWLKFRT